MIFINPCPPEQFLNNQFRKRQILVVHTGASTGQRYFYIRYASHASLPFLHSRSQRQRSFCSATGITNLWKNPKKNISDQLADKIVFIICIFANQKTVSTSIWFWLCTHNLIRLKTVKKNVYFDKFRNHATMKEEIVAMCDQGKCSVKTSFGQMAE